MNVVNSATRTDSVPVEVRIANAETAVAKYENPAKSLRMVGVTGTNGKTTTVHILRALLDSPQQRSASIGTLGVLIGRDGDTVPGGLGLTTPGPDELQRVLRDLVDRDIASVVMEVSSHALDQHRIHGVTFDAVAFSNITRDHLDYHKTMEAYFAAKASLLTYLKPHGFAAINLDDDAWRNLPNGTRRVFYSTESSVSMAAAGNLAAVETTGSIDGADNTNSVVQAVNIETGSRGSHWTLRFNGNEAPVSLPLIGDFNISNALCAATIMVGLRHSVAEVAEGLSRTPQVPGRLEMLAEAPTVLRDYAHTPDALERALLAVRPFARGRLIVVFGAGGDRDAGKRPIMGKIAESLADVAIVTSDNPRTESPSAIIDDIEKGMTLGQHKRIEDRREAIAYALSIAEANDVVVLAGKGHETYQIIGDERHPFDEREIVQSLLTSL